MTIKRFFLQLVPRRCRASIGSLTQHADIKTVDAAEEGHSLKDEKSAPARAVSSATHLQIFGAGFPIPLCKGQCALQNSEIRDVGSFL